MSSAIKWCHPQKVRLGPERGFMTSRFFVSIKKWPLSFRLAISSMTELPQYGETRRLDFIFGPPSEGRLPLQISIDGRRALLVELSDTKPSSLRTLRDWMERCLVHDREGTLHPELATIDCVNTVVNLAMIHVGWDNSGAHASPISLFVVTCSDRHEPPVKCFCHTVSTIRRLYKAIMDCLQLYRNRFDNPRYWYDVQRFNLLDSVSITDRLLSLVRSRQLEKIL